ncbi:hypothetical protein J4E91_009098 [Alternaria rosae]|nr:hypothetical protein J4E91_009098 [Alternaria rosae]
MRFSTISIAALAGLAAAAPNAIAKRESQQMTNVISFAAQQADCSIFDCAAVIGAGVCIAAGLATVPVGVAAVVACVSGGAPSLCGCAGCIDALGDFLTENNLCPE